MWALGIDPLQEQQLLSTAEPSPYACLQPRFKSMRSHTSSYHPPKPWLPGSFALLPEAPDRERNTAYSLEFSRAKEKPYLSFCSLEHNKKERAWEVGLYCYTCYRRSL